MASLSLPRVLHPRKTSLEIERENFEKSQVCQVVWLGFVAVIVLDVRFPCFLLF
jgi:hypothetical protein